MSIEYRTFSLKPADVATGLNNIGKFGWILCRLDIVDKNACCICYRPADQHKDLANFSDEPLIYELKRRGYKVSIP